MVRFGVFAVYALQLALLLLLFCSVKRHMTPAWNFIYIELVILTVLLDMALVVIHMLQRRRERMAAQLEEQEFLIHMEQVHEQAGQEMRKDAKRLYESLSAELSAARNALENRAGEGEAGRPGPTASEEWDRSFCANAIVNVVLREKFAMCQENNIPYTYKIQIPQEVGIADYHLCSVFSNLLDNAIEASLAVPESDRRISVQAGGTAMGCSELNIGMGGGGYFCARVENTCTEEYAGRRRREGRGYGKEILEEIVTIYDGQMNTEFRSGTYIADIVLRTAYVNSRERAGDMREDSSL